MKYIPKGQTLPVTASPHDYTVVHSKIPGTVTIKFHPFLETTSLTVVVDSPASPKIDYNLHLSIKACFEHGGSNMSNFEYNFFPFLYLNNK